jgi:hypothetical protein
MADTEDHETDDDVEMRFTPSYHLEWLLGPDTEVIFEFEDEE